MQDNRQETKTEALKLDIPIYFNPGVDIMCRVLSTCRADPGEYELRARCTPGARTASDL